MGYHRQHKNYLDHVYAVSDDTGDLIEYYRYTAYGEQEVYNQSGTQLASTAIGNEVTWNTRRIDELTGFYMYQFRHYIAVLGKWGSRDPIGERGGINLYSFVGNDAINRWDELGLLFDFIDDFLDELNQSLGTPGEDIVDKEVKKIVVETGTLSAPPIPYLGPQIDLFFDPDIDVSFHYRAGCEGEMKNEAYFGDIVDDARLSTTALEHISIVVGYEAFGKMTANIVAKPCSNPEGTKIEVTITRAMAGVTHRLGIGYKKATLSADAADVIYMDKEFKFTVSCCCDE